MPPTVFTVSRSRRLRMESLEDRRLLASTGNVPILHILTEIGPQDTHDFHPDHDADFYQSVLNASGSADEPLSVPAVNYSDFAGSTGGHFGEDVPFPDGMVDNFALEATANFHVQPAQAGQWTFGVLSDDGARLRIDGFDVIVDDAVHAPQDSFATVSLAPGLHSLELVYFDWILGAEVELFAAPGTHSSFNSSFELFSSSVFMLDGAISVRPRASFLGVSSLAEADALLAEPNHNIVGFFEEASVGTLHLQPAVAGDLDGTADGIVGPYEFSSTTFDVFAKRRVAIEAADADFDFSMYDTNPQDGIITPDELLVVLITGDEYANNHVATFRPESDFVPGTFQRSNLIDLGTGLPFVAEQGQLPNQSGLFPYRNLYYAHDHPTQPQWTADQAVGHFVQSSQPHAISGATNTNPIVITSSNHGLATGDRVFIYGVQGNTSANGSRVVTRIDNDRFGLNNIAGNGVYTSGGTWVRGSFREALDGGSVRWTDADVTTNDGVTVPKGFRVAGVGQWTDFLTHTHEISHLLHPDALDLYNYEAFGVDAGINNYSTMGATFWGTVHHDPWTKMRLGWVTPSVVTAPGTFVLDDVASSGQVFKIVNPNNSQEYFLIENRWGGDSYDAQSLALTDKVRLPGPGVADEGIAIWHVDESYLPAFKNGVFSGIPFLRKIDAGDTPLVDSDDLFDGSTDFHVLTAPNSNWNDGSPSNIVVTAISDPGPQVSLEIDFTGVLQDHLEANDAFESASDLGAGDASVTDLTMHLNDQDYFRWTAPASGTLTIDVLFSDADGDLDATLYRNDATRTVLNVATSTNDNEQLSASVTEGEEYVLQVYGYQGALQDNYQLSINGPDPTGDRFEWNNSFDHATDLGTGSLSEMGLSVHSAGDKDFYRWFAPVTGPIDASITFNPSGDLDLFMYDDQMNLIDASNGITGSESVQGNVVQGESYYFKVEGYLGAVNSSYDLEIVSPEVPEDLLEPNDDIPAAYNLGAGDVSLSGLTVHESDNADYYQWHAPDDGLLQVRLDFVHAVGDLDVGIYDANGQLIAASASTTDDESVQVGVEKGAAYYIGVFGFDGARHFDYGLNIDGPDIKPDRMESNDAFATARSLPAGDSYLKDLSIHEDGNEDYYHWVAAADGRLDLNLFFDDDAGDLDLFLYEAANSDGLLASSTSSTDSEHITYTVEQGHRYYIQVNGFFDAINFDYALSIDGPEVASADFDMDGDVDGRDFLLWQGGYGTPVPFATKGEGDADVDADVDGSDLDIWQQQYGALAPIAAALAMPAFEEPASAQLASDAPVSWDELADLAVVAMWDSDSTGELTAVAVEGPRGSDRDADARATIEWLDDKQLTDVLADIN